MLRTDFVWDSESLDCNESYLGLEHKRMSGAFLDADGYHMLHQARSY